VKLRCEVLARTQDLDRANGLLHGELAERHRAEAKLQAAQEHLCRILEAASEGIWVADARGRTEFANARAAEMFGLNAEEMLGRPFVDLVPENLRQAAAADLDTLAAGRTAKREMKVLRADGSEVWLILSTSILRDAGGAVAGAVAVFMDVTAQRRAQEELEQAHKLEAVGRLASGIAHEINTPIQYIGDNTTFLDEAFTGLASLLQQHRSALAGGTLDGVRERLERAARDLDLDYLLEQVPRTLVRTLEGVKRVATIVRAMKEFAHPDQLEMVATDLNRTITATLEVSRNEYRYVADVVMNLGDVPPVTCHPGELSQVFLNIVVNAAHAIEDVVKGTQNKGTIGLATRLEGDEVVIAISDTGGGIPPAVREKIFEPFYTTKEVGRGTGQGLAIARNVVRKHRGSITFTTAIGQGTTFFIRVPIEPLKRETPRAA
jgi:two-component system, NtrC family, sensor kinase